MSEGKNASLQQIVNSISESAAETMVAAIAWITEAQRDQSTFTPERREGTAAALNFYTHLMGLVEAIEEGRHTDALIRMHWATVYEVLATVGYEAAWGHDRLEEVQDVGDNTDDPDDRPSET